MMKSKRRALWSSLFLFSFIALMGSGCSRQTKHQVLTFFFDGVPPLEEEKAEGETAPAKGGEATLAKGGEAVYVSTVEREKYFLHGPYSAKACDACHSTGQSAALRPLAGQEKGFAGIAMGPTSARLRYDKTQLCFRCHEEKRPINLLSQYKWIHGPVASGACLYCHEPHKTKYQYMLLDMPVKKLCFQCHKQEDLLAMGNHTSELMETQDCIQCHDPHSSQANFGLKREKAEAAPEAKG